MATGEALPTAGASVDFGEDDPSAEGERVLVLGSTAQSFPTNYIRTTRYRWWSFVFVNLVEQFSKVSNIFFLLNMIIALIPGVSPIIPITSILPLIFVVAVSMAKDGIEDFARYKADRAANNTPVWVLRDGEFKQVPSEKIVVGDVLRLSKDEAVPCDAVLLHSSNSRAAGGEDGVAFIDTAQLDGETNLKPRSSVSAALSNVLTGPAEVSRFLAGDPSIPLSSADAGAAAAPGSPSAAAHDPRRLVPKGGVVVAADPPCASLSKWNARIARVRKTPGQELDVTALDLDNLLLRGHVVRNTQSVYLACVYTGNDTKLSKNLRAKRTKRSTMDLQLNSLVTVLLGLFVLLTLSLAGLQLLAINRDDGFDVMPYLVRVYEGEGQVKTFFFGFFTFFVLLSFMMPISLFVSMELVKAFQATFMRWDDLMSDADLRSVYMDHPALRLSSRSALTMPKKNLQQADSASLVGVDRERSALARAGSLAGSARMKRSDAGSDGGLLAVSGQMRRRHSVVAASAYGLRAVQAAEADDALFDEEEAANAFLKSTQPPTNEVRRMAVKSSGLNDELAVVAAVFSDKTGTLTENVMRFHSAAYGFHGSEPIPFFGSATVMPPQAGPDSELCEWAETNSPGGGVAPIVGLTQPDDAPSNEMDAMRGVGSLFLSALATCHAVLAANAPDASPAAAAKASEDPSTSGHSPSASRPTTSAAATATPPHPSGSGRVSNDIVYEGPSTDEVALVSGAAANGFTLVGRTSDTVTVRVPSIPSLAPYTNGSTHVRYAGGHTCSEDPMRTLMAMEGASASPMSRAGPVMKWRVAAMLPFNSDRKRMSVVVQLDTPDDPPQADGFGNGPFFVFSKGADANMIPLLKGVTNGPDGPTGVPQWALSRLHNYSLIGLRTLLTAYRTIPADAVRKWLETEWKPASVALGDKREQMKDAAAAAMERELILLGVTAVEDELQQGVPETIEWLLNAGVLVWVLTGDKRETAYNIAVLANLITVSQDTVLHIRGNTEEDVVASLEVALQAAPQRPSKILRRALKGKKICSTFPSESSSSNSVFPAEQERKGRTTMIIDGHALEKVFQRGSKAFPLFQRLSLLVDAGICCRVMPLQKANVVKLFRNYGLVCCSIGDGANDVSMILEATVGVGIMGLEGSQAERASDYAVPKFRHLTRLLAVHGRKAHCGNAFLIQYSFYKNLTLALCQVWFSFYNGFTGQSLFDSWVLTFFNVFFTSIPPLVIGTLERDLDDVSVMQYPRAYQELADGLFFSVRNILSWFAAAVIHSVVIFFASTVDSRHADMADGHGIWVSGTIGATALVCVVLLKAALHKKLWTSLSLLSIVGSICMYLLFIYAYNTVLFVPMTDTSAYFDVVNHAATNVRSVGWTVLLVVTLFAADLAWLSPSRTWLPSVRDRLLYRAHSVRESSYTSWVPQWVRFLALCCCCCPFPVSLSTLRNFIRSRHWLMFTQFEQPNLRTSDHAKPGTSLNSSVVHPRSVPVTSDAPRAPDSRAVAYPHRDGEGDARGAAVPV